MPNDFDSKGDNVAQFPIKGSPEILVGPFSYYKVVVEGRAIPNMTGFRDGDMIGLVLDGRLSISVSPEIACDVASFAANAMAIGAGYSHLSADMKDRPFAPQCVELGGVPSR